MPTTELEIFEIELTNADEVSSITTVGLAIDTSGAAPVIDLLNVQENEGASIVEDIFKIAPAIRDQYFPDLNMADIEWKMTSNHERVGIAFQEIDGVTVRADFPNGIPDGEPSFVTIDEFRKALASSEGFDAHYNGFFGRPTTGAGEATSIIAIAVPEHPKQVMYMQHSNPLSELVLVDPRRFMPEWQESDRLILGESSQYIFTSDVETAIQHTEIEPTDRIANSPEVGELSFNAGEVDGISIQGRHRTANPVTLGANLIPVALNRDGNDIDAFKARYEYRGQAHLPQIEPLISTRNVQNGLQTSSNIQGPRVTDFSETIGIAEMSNEQISRALGGVPVISMRPEDLPHFDPLRSAPYSQGALDARVESIETTITNIFPNFRTSEEVLRVPAGHHDASVLINFSGPQNLETVNFFVLFRPSLELSVTQRVSGFSGLPAEDIQANIPVEDYRALTVWHEVGHMKAEMEGVKFLSPWHEELYADTFALDQYLKNGGSQDVVDFYIRERAISGFLKTDNKYFLAPALLERFQEGNPNPNQDVMQTWAEMIELRLRVANTITEDDNNRILKNYSSEQIQDALFYMNRGETEQILDTNLRSAMADLDRIFVKEGSLFEDKMLVFEALNEVVTEHNVNDRVSANGAFIVDSARQHTVYLNAIPAADITAVTDAEITPTQAQPSGERTYGITQDVLESSNALSHEEFFQALESDGWQRRVSDDTVILISPDEERVVKYIHPIKNAAEAEFSRFSMENPVAADNPHIVQTEHLGQLQDGLFVVMENLQPLSSLDHFDRVNDEALRSYRTLTAPIGLEPARADAAVQYLSQHQPELLEAVAETIGRVVNSSAGLPVRDGIRLSGISTGLDAKPDNVMVRIDENGNQQIVLIDQFQLRPWPASRGTSESLQVTLDALERHGFSPAANEKSRDLRSSAEVPTSDINAAAVNADLAGGRIAARAGLALAPLDMLNRYGHVNRAVAQGNLGLAAEEGAIGALALSAAYADYLSLKSARGISQIAGKASLPLAVAYGTYETAMGLRQGDMERALNGGGGTTGAIAGSLAGGNLAKFMPSKWAKAAAMIGGGVIGAVYGAEMANTTHAMIFTNDDGSFVDSSQMYEQLNAMIQDAENGRHGWQMSWQRKYLIDGNENINPEEYPAAYALYERLKVTLENQEPPPENIEQDVIKLLRTEAYRRLLDDGELIIPGPYNPADSDALSKVLGDQIAATTQLFNDNAIALHAAVTFGQNDTSIDAYHILNNLWHDRQNQEKIDEMIENNPHIGLLLERHVAAFDAITIDEDGTVVFEDQNAVSDLLNDIEQFSQGYALELTEAEQEVLLNANVDLADENAYFQQWIDFIESQGAEIDGNVARELEKMRAVLEQEGNALTKDSEADQDIDQLFEAAKGLSAVLSSQFEAQAVTEGLQPVDPDAPVMAFDGIKTTR